MEESPEVSPQESPAVTSQLEPYSDVRGIDENTILTVGEYVPEDMYTYWFNQNTIFKGNESHAAEILENGKDPGLNISQLHAQGITCKNVTVAIIDQPLLPDQPEYSGKVEKYHTVGLTDKDARSSMHGPSVASLLAGPPQALGTPVGYRTTAEVYYKTADGDSFINPSAFIDSVRSSLK